MNKPEDNKALKLSKTPILRKTLRKVKTMQSKYLTNNDDFEKSTALIIINHIRDNWRLWKWNY